MNPKLLKLFLCIALLGISFNNLKAQNITKKVIVSGINALEIDNGIQVYLTQSNTEYLEIKGNESLVKQITVNKTADGTLKISFKENMSSYLWRTDGKIKVYISFIKLNGISVNDGSSVEAKTNLVCDNLSLKINDGSSVKMSLTAQKINLNINDGSSVYISGKANILDIKSNDGSSVNAELLESKEVNALVNDGSSVSLFVSEKVNIKANDGSSVSYKGNPKSKNIQSSESSSISKK